jgi:hypothetical protein
VGDFYIQVQVLQVCLKTEARESPQTQCIYLTMKGAFGDLNLDVVLRSETSYPQAPIQSLRNISCTLHEFALSCQHIRGTNLLYDGPD